MKYLNKVPMKMPLGLVENFDAILFEMCRNDDYEGLYEEFMKKILQFQEDTSVDEW